VQCPLANLPLAQQVIATADPNFSSQRMGLYARLRSWFRTRMKSAVNGVLWFVHGCPRLLNAPPAFTVESLAAICTERNWPLLEEAQLDSEHVADCLSRVAPDLVVVLGELSSLPETNVTPGHGWLRARTNEVHTGVTRDLHIRIEHLAKPSGPVQDLSFVTLPQQVHDSAVGVALKADLITDDMLMRAVSGVQAGGAWQAATEVKRWLDDVLSPYLGQLGSSITAPAPAARRWYRSVWSLSLESVILCSPAVVARNWLRRLRSRYPVLILVHHLVSDRAHRMSISTEAFWRQVLFLRRHYRVVSLTEVSEMLLSGRGPSPAVSLTFDDGYADNFVSLRAVAAELDVPVSLFITTQPVELHKEFQHDVTKGQLGSFPLTWPQIRYWKDRGAEFGSHTRTHIKCGIADCAILREEIVGSKIDFETQLGDTPRFFAFPYGNRGDMSPEAAGIAASAYPHFLSAFGGENHPDQDQAHAHLFRKNAYPEPWELELELQSVFDLANGAKRALGMGDDRTRRAAQGAKPAVAAPLLAPPLNFEGGENSLLTEPSQGVQRLIKPS